MVVGVAAMIVCGSLATLVMDDPQLDRVRDELEDDDDDGGEREIGDVGEVVDGVLGAIQLVDAVATGPVTLPAFASHPYAAGHASGLTAPTRLDEEDELAPTRGSGPTPSLAARVAIDGAWQYHGLFRGRFAAETDGARRFGAGLQVYAWGHPGERDHAVLASTRLHFVVGNWSRAIVRTGPALDVMHSWTPSTRVTAFGGDWGLGIDVFPHRPFVLSLDGQIGILGRRTLYAGGRATFGVVIRRVEIFGGYEHKQIGRARLGGPLFGLRVWF